MSRVVVTVLPVGQGAMNLIEVYEEGVLVNLSLIDCGTDRTRPAKFEKLDTPVRESVEYVVEKMRQRAHQEGDVFLDNVLFTHRDSDHWTLFDSLWEKLFEQSIIVAAAGDRPLRCGQNTIDGGIEEEFLADLSVDLAEYRRTMSCLDGAVYWSDFHCRVSFLEQKKEVKMRYAGSDGRYILTLFFSMTWSGLYLYDNEKEKTIVSVVSKKASQGSVAEGMIAGERRREEFEDPYPENYEQAAVFWADFGRDIISEVGSMEMLGQLDYYFEDLSFLNYTGDNIIEWLTEHGEVQGVIGRVLVGGSTSADQTKTGRDRGVKKMLRRAEILSVHGVFELARGYSYELGDPFVLYILERLELETLNGIEITGAQDAGNTAIQKNATSAVSSLESNEKIDFPKFIFTGDATIHTFYAMYRSRMFEERERAVWTAPHHGSYQTIKGGETTPGRGELFPRLLNIFNPRVAIISAGYCNKHGHPNMTFVRWMREHLRKKHNVRPFHPIYYNCNDKSDAEWRMEIINENLFTAWEGQEEDPTVQMHCFRAYPDASEFSYTHREIAGDSLNAGRAAEKLDGKESVKTGKPEFAVPHTDLFFRRH